MMNDEVLIGTEKTILVADPSAAIQKVAELTLRDKYEVITVSTGADARRFLEGRTADLVLTEIRLKDGDGYSLCEWIKGRPGRDHIPVVLLHGTFDKIDTRRVSAVKADEVLQKPFQPLELLNTVERLTGF